MKLSIVVLAFLLLFVGKVRAADYYFTACNGNTVPCVQFHYPVSPKGYAPNYGCQDWQGGAAYLGPLSYLGPLPPQNQPQPDPNSWQPGMVMPIVSGKNGIRGGSCATSSKAVTPQIWSYIKYPTTGGMFKRIFNNNQTCSATLATVKAVHNLNAKFSSRCMAEGANTI
jgi:hypothetical protein